MSTSDTNLPEAEPAGPTAPSAFAEAILARQPLRDYQLLACLAGTDRTAVFKADDRSMERTVAVKFMRPWPGREGAVEDFFSLAGSIARLRCPGVARGLDAGRGDGDFFVVYEYLPGETLAARLERRQTGRLTEREALKLVRAIAQVLQSLFELGHPHGHVTPTNIVQRDGGAIGLTDVGFAWNLAWPDDAAAFAAAPDYLPPEKIRGDLNIDIRGDLYALGAVWYKALLGEPVFRASTPEETLRLHLEAKPTPPREVDPRLGAATSELLLALLAKDRDARPRTPKEFLRKLRAHPLLADADDGAGESDTTEMDGIEETTPSI